jgi:hypothetical protein
MAFVYDCGSIVRGGATVRSNADSKRSRAVHSAVLLTLIDGDMRGRTISFAVRYQKADSTLKQCNPSSIHQVHPARFVLATFSVLG